MWSDWWSIPLSIVGGVVLLWLTLMVTLWIGKPDEPGIRDSARLLPDLVRLIKRLATDPGMPRGVRVRLAVLLGYLALPIDLHPGLHPRGWLRRRRYRHRDRFAVRHPGCRPCRTRQALAGHTGRTCGRASSLQTARRHRPATEVGRRRVNHRLGLGHPIPGAQHSACRSSAHPLSTQAPSGASRSRG